MSKSQGDTHIKVVCRLRPLNELEKSQGGQSCVIYSQSAIKLKVNSEENTYDFSFDRIFGPDSTQNEVFQFSARNVIESVMNGYNGTIFAYGQTSSGKTFTMEGPSIENEELKGIIPRMMDCVFEQIINASENLEFTVKISFLEIYNEKIIDLLDPRKTNLQIKEDKSKGIYVQDATEIYVNSVDTMKKVMKTGADNRTIAATRMNERSSRSHSIFMLSVFQKEIQLDATKQSRLFFIDLAGSEKIAKTLVTGQQLEEAKNINKSLSALGNVINALTSSKNEHIPYRDSKLTRILQESLGGNSKTTLIIACSMCSYNDKETLSTLRFGYRAKSIKNKPIINVERSVKELTSLLEAAELKIKNHEDLILKLQNQLENSTVTGGNNSILDASIIDFDEEMLKNHLKSSDFLKNQSANISEKESLKNQGRNNNDLSISMNIEGKDNLKNQTPNLPIKSKNNTLTILKQHIQISSLKEEIKTVRSEKIELEQEINRRNQELYQVNEQLMSQEEGYSSLIQKYANFVQKLQINQEKLSLDNLSFGSTVSQIRRELLKLKEELNLIVINGYLGELDSENLSIALKIHNTVRLIEEIESFLEQFNSKIISIETFNKEIEENYLISNQLITEETSLKTEQSEDINYQENYSANLPKKRNLTSHKRKMDEKGHVMSRYTDKRNTVMYNYTDPEEESKESKIPTVSSWFSKKDQDKDWNEIMKKINDIGEPELKVKELCELVSNQRKTIDSLFKVNQELNSKIDDNNTNIDGRISKYKLEINELNKLANTRLHDYDKKIEESQKLLIEKTNEIKQLKSKYEKELSQRKNQLTEIKVNFDKLQRIVNGNSNLKKVAELEQKLRELGNERQKLYNDLHSLRSEVDSREDDLSSKTYQIHLLQSSLNSLANQLDTLKYINNSLQNNNPIVSGSSNHNRQKSLLNFMDKNIIKPIKGGGGNIENFQKKNFLEKNDKINMEKKFQEEIIDIKTGKEKDKEKNEDTSFFSNIKRFFQ